MTSPALSVVRALALAAARHSGQKAKGKPERAFVEHLIEVAALVVEATEGADAVLATAALLHDSLEKTDTSLPELEQRFGPAVASVVAEVSDDEELSEDERKREQVSRAPSLSPRAKMIRLADKTSNLWALATEGDDAWPLEKRRAYLAWAAAVAEGCRGVSAMLDQAFDEAAAAFAGGLVETVPPIAGVATSSDGAGEASSQMSGALTPRQRP